MTAPRWISKVHFYLAKKEPSTHDSATSRIDIIIFFKGEGKAVPVLSIYPRFNLCPRPLFGKIRLYLYGHLTTSPGYILSPHLLV